MSEIEKLKKTAIICFCIIAVMAGISLFVAKPVVVSGESMENNYFNGEYLLVNRMIYRFDEPQRGDVVVCKTDDHLIIKRIIAVGGDEIEISAGKTLLNGKPIDEFYIKEEMMGDFPKTDIPAGEVFVMGDNRNNSLDSRDIGTISENKILGRVTTAEKEFGDIRSERTEETGKERTALKELGKAEEETE